MKTIIVILASYFFSSCMHLGMTGMAGHGEREGNGSQTTLEKELAVGNVKANALFPVMETGKETIFTLRLTDLSTQEGLGSAEVYGQVDYVHRGSSDQMMHGAIRTGRRDTTEELDQMNMMQHRVDSSAQTKDHNGMMIERSESDHDKSKHLEATGGKEQGVYTFSTTVSDTGEYSISFHVVSLAGQKLTPEIFVEAKRTVSDAPMHAQGGMMGMGGSSTYVIVGGVLMGTMMVVAWLVRGGMHW